MKIYKAEHEITAVKQEQYPEGKRPEIAFVGRSNVGKSSMINSMCNRKSIARVGKTPGKTRVINFYTVNDEIYLVDLPGYGYANASKKLQRVWNNFTDYYLQNRENIVLIVSLIDIRHKPTLGDMKMIEWLQQGEIPFAVCAVKSDKLTRNKGFQSSREIVKTLRLDPDTPFIIYSSEQRKGIDELWEVIDFYTSSQETD